MNPNMRLNVIFIFVTIIVGSDQVSDQEAENLSMEIAKKIQDEMVYPGQVKITVIRETRSVSFAK